MRIAIVSRYRHIAGGAEVYIRSVLPLLQRHGCSLLLAHEVAAPLSADSVLTPEVAGIPVLHFAEGAEAAFLTIRGWRPDVIFSQGLDDLTILERLADEWPVVHFAHDYQGLCISGARAWKRPEQVCTRSLGPACLAHYLPHGCGGSNPLTMIRLYGQQQRRLAIYRKMNRILTNSGFVGRQMLLNGIPADRVMVCGILAPDLNRPPTPPRTRPEQGPWQVLYMGRMLREKGGHHLIPAAARAAQLLGIRLEVTFLGDGSERAAWEHLAAGLRSPLVGFEFAGWRSARDCEAFCDRAHVLVMPGVWPEPLGLTGIEASLRGLPVAAYGSGGITEWLIDGVNGFLAPGDRPQPDPLAQAIVAVLQDGQRYTRLSAGGMEGAHLDFLRNHVPNVLNALRQAAACDPGGGEVRPGTA